MCMHVIMALEPLLLAAKNINAQTNSELKEIVARIVAEQGSSLYNLLLQLGNFDEIETFTEKYCLAINNPELKLLIQHILKNMFGERAKNIHVQDLVNIILPASMEAVTAPFFENREYDLVLKMIIPCISIIPDNFRLLNIASDCYFFKADYGRALGTLIKSVIYTPQEELWNKILTIAEMVPNPGLFFEWLPQFPQSIPKSDHFKNLLYEFCKRNNLSKVLDAIK